MSLPCDSDSFFLRKCNAPDLDRIALSIGHGETPVVCLQVSRTYHMAHHPSSTFSIYSISFGTQTSSRSSYKRRSFEVNTHRQCRARGRPVITNLSSASGVLRVSIPRAPIYRTRGHSCILSLTVACRQQVQEAKKLIPGMERAMAFLTQCESHLCREGPFGRCACNGHAAAIYHGMSPGRRGGRWRLSRWFVHE